MTREVNGNLIARLGHYKPPGDLWLKIVENLVINVELVRLSLWEWLKASCGAAKCGFEPGTFWFFFVIPWSSTRLSPSKKNFFFICFNDSPSKMMKRAFYFILKALVVLKIFKSLSWIFGHVKKPDLIRKIRLILKFMTLQPGEQRITINIAQYLTN